MGEELVMERFRLLERIGSGGMGTVYRAFDERLQRQVAVKEVEAADPERVLREAQAAARLNHPGIVTLYELGERDGRALLVSELVPGETVAAMRSRGLLCDRDVAEIGVDVCEALVHAHERGVVHRDIKPQNLIVGDEAGAGRRAKLMDFGIARLAGAPTLTAHGEVVGTLAYMSPEQAEGELAGPASDVYSLALTLYECWAGVNPVAGRTPAETARRIGTRLEPLGTLRPDLPEGIADTVDACLEADPELRPAPAELCECLVCELAALDAVHLLPGDESADGPPPRRRLGAGRLVALLSTAAGLVALAGPIGLPGAALVLAVLSIPALIVGAPAAALAPLGAPILAQAGLGSAGVALGAAGPTTAARAVLGISSWAWILSASIALGAGPDLGIAADAPSGWAAHPGVAADAILAPMMSPESLLGAAVFAAAAVVLGWLLRLRHAPVALLGAMLWAAGVDAAMSAVGNGALGRHPAGLIAAAALAVLVEYGLLRGRGASAAQAREVAPPRKLGGRRLSGRLA